MDLRLALRMLLKYRGLTLVAGSAIAVAVAIGASFFEIAGEFLHPVVPLPEGDRIISIQYATENPGDPERRILHDFTKWRGTLRTVDDLAVFFRSSVNMITGDGPPVVIHVAEVSAAAFQITRTPPSHGRYLGEDDERPGAPRVVVLGHDAWQSQFGGDAAVVGRAVKLGADSYTIVGVMPAGFRFPINDHYWIPLRVDPSRFEPRQGPRVFVLGRLAEGAAMSQAQAELTAYGHRMAAAFPKEYERLRPVVMPFTTEHADLDDPQAVVLLQFARLLIGALVMIVAANVAILMYARTVARTGEISLRMALGASRRRILMQLFIEAFALSAAGAAAGLGVARIALTTLRELVQSSEAVPFWLSFDVSPSTVLYAAALAVLAAAIFGVVPGLKTTSEQLQVSLRQLGGGTKARLGRTWTFLIVSQVAVAVAVLPVAVFTVWQVARGELTPAGFPVEQFVTAEMAVADDPSLPAGAGPDSIARAAMRTARQTALIARLEAEPEVAAVTFSSGIPGDVTTFRQIEFDGGPAREDDGRRSTGVVRVAPGMFAAYGVNIIAGRAFDAGDREATTNRVIVNRTFAEQFIGTGAVLGRQFRYARTPANGDGTDGPGKWYEIAGVVNDFPGIPIELVAESQAAVYHPEAAGEIDPVVVSVRFRAGVPDGFVGRFRQIGAEVDPTLQLDDVMPLGVAYGTKRSMMRLLAWALAIIAASVLLLSAAGIYALMSFTVAHRTREIGIRAALGAGPRRLLVNVFGRVLRQLALGVLLGSLSSAGILSATTLNANESLYLLAAVAAIMLMVGLMAALGPARRSLRIDPLDALRADS